MNVVAYGIFKYDWLPTTYRPRSEAEWASARTLYKSLAAFWFVMEAGAVIVVVLGAVGLLD